MRIFWLLRTAIITIKPQMKKKIKELSGEKQERTAII